jgi:hypothetical protein
MRNATVSAYKHKTVYEIPLMHNEIKKHYRLIVKEDQIVVEATDYREVATDVVPPTGGQLFSTNR